MCRRCVLPSKESFTAAPWKSLETSTFFENLARWPSGRRRTLRHSICAIVSLSNETEVGRIMSLRCIWRLSFFRSVKSPLNMLKGYCSLAMKYAVSTSLPSSFDLFIHSVFCPLPKAFRDWRLGHIQWPWELVIDYCLLHEFGWFPLWMCPATPGTSR